VYFELKRKIINSEEPCGVIDQNLSSNVKICLVFGLSISLFIFILMQLDAYAIDDSHRLKVIFRSIHVNNNHEMGSDAEWILHAYVNEKPMNFSSGTGLGHVKNDETISFNNKFNAAVVPSNGTFRILLVGLEQDNTNTKLPFISSELENAIPSINFGGIEIGGKMVAAWYNISQKLINYDTDDPVGILSKAYSRENNFGVGSHSDCSRANENVVDVQKQLSTSCDFILDYEIRDLNHTLPAPVWHDWETMEGIPQTDSIPAAISIVPGEFEMAALGVDGQFFLLPYDYGWQEYSTLGRQTSSSEFFYPSYSLQPAVMSEAPDRTFVFALGADKSVWNSWFDEQAGGWSKWVNSGGSFISAPTVLLSGTHAANVYGVGKDHYVWERQMDLKNAKWNIDWNRKTFLGDDFKSSPSFVLPRGDVKSFHAFALAKDGSIWHGTFNAVTRGIWPFNTINWDLQKQEYLTNSSKFISQPSAIETAYGRIGLFAQTGDNQLIQKTYNYFDGIWPEVKWNTLGNVTSSPVVATPSSYRLDVFAKNGTSIIHNWYGN